MGFKTWFSEQLLLEQRATIFVDLDNTLIDRTQTKICERPKLHHFLTELQKLAPVCILTHGPTDLQSQVAKKVGITIPVIGKDQYDRVKTLDTPILIDNDAVSNKHTELKMEALGIDNDRVIKIRAWYCGKKDHELDRVLKEVQQKLSSNEWVEKNPQPVLKLQKFKDYRKALSMAQDRKKKFLKLLKGCAAGNEVIVDIKSEKSFDDKTKKRGKHPRKVFDVLRGAILVKRKKDIEKVVKNIKDDFLIKKIEHKVDPRREKFGYYGATHIDVVVSGMICEIQVMTKKLWSFKFETDKIYHKYRSKDEMPQEALDKTKKLFKKANND